MPDANGSHSTPKGTLALIHGAWAGSWVWGRLQPLLVAQGWTVVAPDLPGSSSQLGNPAEASLQACVDHVLDELKRAPGPLVLVGHSGGGAVATQVAETLPERARGVVYIAGMMLPSGTGFTSVVQAIIEEHPDAAGIGPHLEWEDDRMVTRVPPDAAASIFFNDLPPAEARRAAERLGPQAEGSRALVPWWTAERFGKLPRLYIEATEDRSVTLAAQRKMQAMVPGAEVISLRSGHAPQVSQPGAVAGAISGFARRILPAYPAPLNP